MSQTAHEPVADPPVPDPDSSAETENTEESGGPPESIPYSRFKEVNDRYKELKPYEELADAGYDHETLDGLVRFDEQFQADPARTWLDLAERLKDELPDSVVEAIEAHKEGRAPTPATPALKVTPEDENPDEEPPAWAKPLLEDKVAREEAAEAERLQAELDKLVEKWDELDEAEGIEIPESKQGVYEIHRLNYIAHYSRTKQYNSYDALLKDARDAAMAAVNLFQEDETSDEDEGEEPKPPAPKTVPKSPSVALQAPEPPKTLAEARRGAEEFLRGRT